jgi:hypothetical protein
MGKLCQSFVAALRFLANALAATDVGALYTVKLFGSLGKYCQTQSDKVRI